VDNDDQPILVHAHIPKTAGTSFNELLSRQFQERHYQYLHPDPSHIITLEEFEELLTKRPNLRSISSHCVRTFPPRIGGRPALYVTFLREPLAAFLSLLRYTRKEYQNLPDEVKKWWPDNTPSLSLRELAYLYLAPGGSYVQSCQQTRFFCPPDYTKLLITPDYNQFGINSYSVARSNLRQFFFVGIVEQMEKSLHYLKRRLLDRGVNLDIDDVPRENRIDSSSEDLSWLHVGDSIGRLVIRSNANDNRLYQEWKYCLESGYQESRGNASASCWEPPRNLQAIETKASAEEARENVVRAFSSWEYQRINARRLEHLASLGMEWSGKTVWEVSAGIGDLTSFFLDRSCSVTVSDVRTEVLEILSERFSFLHVERFNFDEPSSTIPGVFDCVFCYGSLYHSSNPSVAIAQMAKACKQVFLLECCVSPGDDLNVNPVSEDRNHPTQSFHGVGCRPTRRWLFESLKANFEFVYCPITQPSHEQFPIEWTTAKNDQGLLRSIFIAARSPIDNALLKANLLEKQRRFA